MSTATAVPETHELEGDDALETLRRTGTATLLKHSFQRFRAADGFSHARALAFQVTLTLLPAMIAAVGFATLLHADQLRRILQQTAAHLAPGPAGQIITTALQQGSRAAGGGARAALLFGLVAALVSGATAMGQIERGVNRIYGVEQDRPTLRKYGHGLVLALSAGLLAIVAFVLIIAGSEILKAAGVGGTGRTVWNVLRWPVSLALVVVAVALLFREAPRRRQPAWSWLAVGSAISVLLWLVLTGLLGLYLRMSRSFGQTYGPLAGVIGLLLWTFLTSLAIYLGIAFAAQLEAVRAGASQPTTGEQRNLEIRPGAGRRGSPTSPSRRSAASATLGRSSTASTAR